MNKNHRRMLLTLLLQKVQRSNAQYALQGIVLKPPWKYTSVGTPSTKHVLEHGFLHRDYNVPSAGSSHHKLQGRTWTVTDAHQELKLDRQTI